MFPHSCSICHSRGWLRNLDVQHVFLSLAPVFFSRWFWNPLCFLSRYATQSLLSCHNMSPMWYHMSLASTYLACSGPVVVIGSLWEWEWGFLQTVCSIFHYAFVSRSLNHPYPIYIFHRWMAHAIQRFLWTPYTSCALLVHLSTCVVCGYPMCMMTFFSPSCSA